MTIIFSWFIFRNLFKIGKSSLNAFLLCTLYLILTFCVLSVKFPVFLCLDFSKVNKVKLFYGFCDVLKLTQRQSHNVTTLYKSKFVKSLHTKLVSCLFLEIFRAAANTF